jgi:tetratricopeptide (TPR) repeat protein
MTAMRAGPTIALMAFALLAASARAVPNGASAQEITISASDLLEYYEAGEVEAMRDALDRAATGDLGIVLTALRRNARAWIEADGPQWRDRRRTVVALVAIETARAALERQWNRSLELIDWAAALLAGGAPSESERTWHLAALALCEGARDPIAIDAAASRLQKRFPGEPRTQLARAFVREIEFWDNDRLYWGEADTRRTTPSLVAASAVAANHDEAMLRLAYFALYDGNPDQALRFLAQAATIGDDPGHAYLSGLFAGWANARLARWPEAIAAFRAALIAAPGAKTATFHLASALFAAGDRAEADRVMQAAMRANSDAADPWTTYGYGDFRRFTLYVDRVREALR